MFNRTRHLLICATAAFMVAGVPVFAQNTTPAAQVATVGTIHGFVKFGSMSMPGVTISAANTLTGKKVITSTDTDGSYSFTVPSNGRYLIRAELSAFATAAKEVVISTANSSAQIDLEMVLASRAPKSGPQDALRMEQAMTMPGAVESGNADRGARRMNVDESSSGQETGATPDSESPLQGMPALANSSEAANESVSVAGNMGQTQDMGHDIGDVRDRIEEMRSRGDLPGGGEGFGGPGGGPGMFTMSGGGRPGRNGHFNVNTIHGSIAYNLADSALNATPYSLNDNPEKPAFSNNQIGASVGGPLRVPKLFDAGKNTFFFFNMNVTRATSPTTGFLTVPTLAERGCPDGATDQSQCTLPNQFAAPVTNPATGQAFLNNQIPVNSINPVSAALLKFIPLPNASGTQNYTYSNSGLNDTTVLALRITHSFGASQPGRGNNGSRHSRNSANFGFNYSNRNNDQFDPFPGIASTGRSQGIRANAGYTLNRGRWTSNFSANFNQSKSNTRNIFAGVNNVAGNLGLTDIATAPPDWGLPTISFSNGDASLSDFTPSNRRNRTFQLSEVLLWRHGKHNVRFGGDFRRTWIDLLSAPNPNGSYTFNGYATGNDFADFLLGLPVQASIKYSNNMYGFRENSYDGFAMDDWRVASNLTLNIGLRYEYVTPFVEANNQLVNLAVTPGFTSVVPVQPSQNGYPAGLVHSDPNNFAPRIGIAWKPFKKTVVRAGYGINYNIGQYSRIVSQLSMQPPFAFSDTIVCPSGTLPGISCFSLPAFPSATPASNITPVIGFPTCPTAGSCPVGVNSLANNYGIDPNYRLGYVQVWNLNIQREIASSTVVNIGYNGAKGTGLDMLRAPTPPAGVSPFLWETSQGFSIMHAATISVRKRLQHGIGIGGTYTFSKSIDNASSIGGSGSYVAQNDLDLSAERGLSSFDQRHKFTGTWTYNLPWGEGRKWLASGGPTSRILGNWELSGNFGLASGKPFTAHVLGNNADLSRGANGSLRADYIGGPIVLSNPSVGEWFNTAAFASPCTMTNGVETCTYGTSGRNTIIGPGSLTFNMSMAKEIPIKDMMGFELRADGTNVFNTPQYTSIGTNYTCQFDSQGVCMPTQNSTFGRVTGVGSMRQVKISMRFRF